MLNEIKVFVKSLNLECASFRYRWVHFTICAGLLMMAIIETVKHTILCVHSKMWFLPVSSHVSVKVE